MTPITYRNQTIERLEAENKVLREILEQAIHYSKIELPSMNEAAQLSWLQSMRSHVLDILEAAQANAREPGEG